MLRNVLAILLVLSGCAVNQPTMTSAQAVARIDQLIHDTAASLTVKPLLEVIPSSLAPTMCPDDDARVVINRAYWLRDVPKSENMRISQEVRTYWEGQGHRITASGDDRNPDLSGESRPDSFVLALTWAEGDDLYLAATSPCVTR